MKFLDKLKKLLKTEGERDDQVSSSPASKSSNIFTRHSVGRTSEHGKSSPPSLGQHPARAVSISGDAPSSCPNALPSASGAANSARNTPHQKDLSGFLGSPLSERRNSRPGLRQSLDTARGTHAAHRESHEHTAGNSKSMNRSNTAEPGKGKLESSSITKALDPALSTKIKDMVFVEVPVCVDNSEGNEQQQAQLPGAAGYKSDSKDVSAMMNHAFAPGCNRALNFREQCQPKVQRMRSLPMMLDTSLQHHAALQAQAQAEGKAVHKLRPQEALGTESKASEGEAKRPGDTWAKVEQSLLPAKRHTSLKMLLHLDSYDFFSDVNVAEAQDAMGAKEISSSAGNGHTSGLPGGMGVDMQPEKESNVLAVSEALPKGMRRPVWSLNDFIVIKKLHQGYASNVYFSRCQYTQELVVLKVYRLKDQGDLERVQLYREIRVHSKLQHQNIVQFYAAFLEKDCVIIVQEYAAGGDLLRFMYKCGGRLPERQAVNLVLQPFLSALLHLHSQGIIHRDIKPENCLLTDTRVLKLADFGLAVDLREERANTRAGTLEYMSPETLRCPTKKTPDQFKNTPGAQHYEMGADAWAVGTFAYELVVGSPPFKAPGGEMIDTARNIIAVNVTYPSSISEMARSFISSCLRKHSGDRPTVVEMLQHPWIQMFKRRSSVLMPGEMATSTLSAQDLQSQVAMGGARGIGMTPALAGVMHGMRAMGAPGPPLAGLASQGGHAHSNSPAATYHHYHHHHHQ
uniref:Protein kinase domain-containing protein n=1 Tax=Dunaliella tertiolecta TaxID=3047 RepID=A0A7S3VRI1_DUNTE|mmetsp:Transcript_6560/g.17576  ORF Transcript_6560/g.17576 Transcript_6560/m.17576 type:complete len:742 (+) Transcript_6560:61-2286(+)|eukprot:CAMPEP_0202383710 /NCGR_PEP_ID=MMETSP1127-20130417/50794_1 /ASSEMBLY_ACC=CAM_ASM_000462 /TAXON_ID=3047 /ORGANISM="Dunaliella tertiolecta, Strain CCMP1320" /LENGTH=741 /DNA_ID=CAMNT_0048983279 /DNA_START=95 /DNA_END=2320 /DNA_ORIENTATION=-